MPSLAEVSDSPDLDGLDEEERVSAMVEWFLENFRDLREVGSDDLIIGPEGDLLSAWAEVSSDEELELAFGDIASEEQIDSACEILYSFASDWAPASHRIVADVEIEEEEVEDRNGSPALSGAALDIRLEDLGGQLDRIEGAVDLLLSIGLNQLPIGLGHNQPPSEASPRLTHDDLREVRESIEEVRLELAKDDRVDSATVEVLRKAEGRFTKFRRALIKICAAIGLGAAGGVGNLAFDRFSQACPETIEAVVSSVSTLGYWILHLHWPH